jgi:hypothetical protein
VIYRHAALFRYVWWYGVQFLEMTPVLANLAPITTLQRALCLNRGGFMGGGVVVDRDAFKRARGSR